MIQYGDRVYSTHEGSYGKPAVVIAVGTGAWFVSNVAKDQQTAVSLTNVLVNKYGALWENKPVFVIAFDDGGSTLILEEFLVRINSLEEIPTESDEG